MFNKQFSVLSLDMVFKSFFLTTAMLKFKIITCNINQSNISCKDENS